MSQYSSDYKRMVGAVLLKLRNRDYALDEEEISAAKFLADKVLARYFGPDQTPKMIPLEEAHDYMQLAAFAHYQLSGLGEEFVRKYNEKQLSSGKFLLPGELPWHRRWPWKLLLPALVSLAVSLIVSLVALFFHK